MRANRNVNKTELVSAMKAVLRSEGIPNEGKMRKIVSDEVHLQLSEFHANMTLPAIKRIEENMDDRFNSVDKRLSNLDYGQQELKVEVSALKDEVNGLKSDLSDTPSRRQFEELKARVDKHHPIN